MRTLVYDQSPSVIEWIRQQMTGQPVWASDAVAIGIKRDGELIGGAVYEGFTACDVNIHMAGVGNWMTPEAVVAAFHFPFVVMKLRRVTGLVRAKNERSLRVCRKLGFLVEGVKRHAFADDDLIIMGMLREHCRFIGKQS